jgi:hypothetical protein
MRALSLLLAAVLVGTPTPADLQKWLADADSARNAFDEVVIRARATQVSDGQERGSAEFEIYAKGRERALIVFRDEKNSGRKILTNGPRMWLIVPGATNPVPITPSQRLLGGASFGDVARLRFASDYTATLREEAEIVAGRECRVLDLSAKDPHAPYPKVVLRVDSAEHVARKAVFFLPSGKEAKEVLFTKYSQAAGKPIVSEMDIRDLLGRDSRTVTRLEYLDYRPAKLPNVIFTPEGAKGL